MHCVFQSLMCVMSVEFSPIVTGLDSIIAYVWMFFFCRTAVSLYDFVGNEVATYRIIDQY